MAEWSKASVLKTEYLKYRGFESHLPLIILVAELVDALVLGTKVCGFKSHQEYK